MTHSIKCTCFECFCEKQLRRVQRTTKDSWRDEDRRTRRRNALQTIHDNMVIKPIASACLPNLDYYDNRGSSWLEHANMGGAEQAVDIAAKNRRKYGVRPHYRRFKG